MKCRQILLFILAASALALSSCAGNTSESSSIPAVLSVPSSSLSAESSVPEDPKVTAAKEYLKENWSLFSIDGSTSMVPLHQALHNYFTAASETNEEISHSKTVDSFEKFISGENDILLGVDYSDELLQKAADSGIELAAVPITKEAFVFLINVNNTVKNLSVEQLRDIYSGKITNWKQLGGDDQEIVPFQRNDDSGSQIRMQKFMGNVPLMPKKYTSYSMGHMILFIAGYEYYDGTYGTYNTIGYNMYTFTEKQYKNYDVTMLAVNGVTPNDDTVFDESYPLTIYNYLYYDKNNESASEFAENLLIFLMSHEGQELIGRSGYVNLREKLDRVTPDDVETEPEDEEIYIDYYDRETGRFYNIDENGNLLTFDNFPDFVLHGSDAIDNRKARNFLSLLFDSGVVSPEIGVQDGKISLSHYWFDASMDPSDFCNVEYRGRYYNNLTYDYVHDNYLLSAGPQDILDDFKKRGYMDDFPADKIALSDIEIPASEMSSFSLRLPSSDFDYTVVKP